MRCIGNVSKNDGGNNKGDFLIDLDEDEDDFDIPSDDEVEINEDQRIMEEYIRIEREHELKVSERLRRSQTEGNTLLNSSEHKFFFFCSL